MISYSGEFRLSPRVVRSLHEERERQTLQLSFVENGLPAECQGDQVRISFSSSYERQESHHSKLVLYHVGRNGDCRYGNG